MANILARHANFTEWQTDYLSTEEDLVRSNAPVTRAVWTCENLPSGLTLSPEGKISGRPTTIGTYACIFTVTTNWGSTMKTIYIRVTE